MRSSKPRALVQILEEGAMLCIPNVTAEETAVFARLCLDEDEYAGLPASDRDLCRSALSAAIGFVKRYTGIKLDETAAQKQGTGYEVAAELGYAIKTVAAEMIDNRQITMQYTGRNPTVMQILDMHSVNLLPSVEE